FFRGSPLPSFCSLFPYTTLFRSGVLVLLCLYTPGTDLPVCGFHWLTGRLCPLCGLTRGLFQLAKGHWQAAIDYHALSPLVFLARSEEHTSELQSPCNLVCRLLLE